MEPSGRLVIASSSSRERLERDLDETAAGELGLVDLRHELMRVVGALPPRQRAVLVLRYLEDLSQAKTAEILGWSVGTVKSTTSRALDRLRQELPGDPHVEVATPGSAPTPGPGPRARGGAALRRPRPAPPPNDAGLPLRMYRQLGVLLDRTPLAAETPRSAGTGTAIMLDRLTIRRTFGTSWWAVGSLLPAPRDDELD